MADYCVILVTAATKKEGEKIADVLLQKKLVACVNIIPSIKSSYWWKGKIETANEALLIMKTKETLLKKVISAVKANHSYKVPEIIALPIIAGNPDYLKWIRASTILR